MIRSILTFAGMFLLGAFLALLMRAARFEAHADPAAPAGSSAAHPPAAALPPAAAAEKPVNTVCAICGMDVDPKLPTAVYQGKVIGFGCRMCPPKFARDPERWGPLYLRNEVVTR